MKRIIFYVFLLSSLSLAAQERVISGKVTSDDGSALPGVNVVLKGTIMGTTSDIDGNYRLSVPDDANSTLVFSFVGMENQEIRIGAMSVIDVKMEVDVATLSEIVVTAVGIERAKKALGYSVSNLDGEQLAQKSEPDIVRSLQGKVAGINIVGAGGAVGEGTNITIRGNSSLLGNNQPLFVVDGVPFDNTTFSTGSFTSRTTASNRSFDLDPNNIESMTVLKGAAAAALYGSRASNGVIVITTKSGNAKASRQGLEVTVNTSYNIEEVSNLPDYQKRYTQGNNFKYVDGNYGTWGASFDMTQPEWSIPVNSDLILSQDPGSGSAWFRHPYDRYNNPNGAPYFPEFANDSILLRPYNTPQDFFETGSVFDFGVSVTGGNEDATLTAGMSRTISEGIVPFNEGTRTSVNVGGNANLANGLFIGGSATYVRNELTSPPSSGLFTGGTSITERLLYTPPNVNVKGYPSEDANGNPAFYRPDNDNPYFLAKYAPHTSNVDRLYGYVTLGYDILDWLNITYRGGFNVYNQRNLNVLPRGTNASPTGQILEDNIYNSELDGNLILTGTRDLTSDIGLRALIGYNVNQRERRRQAFQGTTIIIDGIHDLDNTQNVIPWAGGITERAYQAFYTDLTFNYRTWLFLNLTGRNDITSTLPKSDRSYFYGGGSLSWIFSEALNLDANTDIFSFGKLRVGFARVGNDTDPYLTQPLNYVTNSGVIHNIASLGFPFTNVVNTVNGQIVSDQLGNSQLKPEFTNEYEIGGEFRLWKNRIGLDVAYYSRSSQDQIVPINVSPASGFDTKVVNIGEVTNEGWEAALDFTPVSLSNGFEWNLFTTFTKNENIVKELAEGLDEVFINGYGNSVQVAHIIGLPYGQVKGTKAARSDDGDLLVDPETGKLIIPNDLEVIADPNPDFLLNVTSRLSFKGITLSALIEYRHGGEIWSGTYNQMYGRGVTPGTVPDHPNGRRITVYIPGVVGDPTTQEAVLDESGNTIPNGTMLTVNDWYFINTFGSAGAHEFSVFDATTIRLREVTLGYTLPQSILSNTPFGSVNVSLSGRNLWYNAVNFPEDLNFDPDTNSLGAGNVDGLNPNQSGNSQGVDFGVIPTTRRFGINLSATF